MNKLKKIYYLIEPSFRGLGIILFILFFNMFYSEYIYPDADYDGKGEIFVFFFNYLNKIGGKILVFGIIILIAIIIIIHDYHKKFGKSEK